MKNMCGINRHRAPLGRRHVWGAVNPGRWPGLRDGGPLGLKGSAIGAPYFGAADLYEFANQPECFGPTGRDSSAQPSGLGVRGNISCGLKGRDKQRANLAGDKSK